MGATATLTQTALVGGPDGDIILSNAAPLPPPVLEDDQVAVSVRAVSLNPVDTKMTGGYHTVGAISGCEFAGVVTAAGAVAKKDWGIQPGDRVTAAIMGMNPLRPRIGAFAQNAVAPARCVLKMRDDWDFAKSAGIGNAWYTVAWSLFHVMGLPAGPELEPLNTELPPPQLDGPRIAINNFAGPNTKKATVLVSGGSSSTGTCAIQLLKIAGFNVVATCSERNFDLVRSYGADAVFSHSSPTATADIKAYTRNSLRLALDCITTLDTTRLCYESFGRSGGRYVALDPYSEAIAATREAVKADWVLGPEMIGEDVGWPAPHGRKANPIAKRFCDSWNRTLQNLLDRGVIRTHPQRVLDTGLAGALDGFEDIRSKKVSGEKLTYTL
ncbi:putative secondary metabolism biosynthetic enzyme [Lecanicillium sp. MT-2017a]|nr:putative secondary metabolism biosynthetic enzyme [Lecanicillium sp. MT-2017a]